mmetsp:Transcript_67984/g.192657  ORF Transcript_67984/g.192657 Transcript_67984/m.192657 type:complete len:202 (-) Transcript_67984:123-728(-)
MRSVSCECRTTARAYSLLMKVYAAQPCSLNGRGFAVWKNSMTSWKTGHRKVVQKEMNSISSRRGGKIGMQSYGSNSRSISDCSLSLSTWIPGHPIHMTRMFFFFRNSSTKGRNAKFRPSLGAFPSTTHFPSLPRCTLTGSWKASMKMVSLESIETFPSRSLTKASFCSVVILFTAGILIFIGMPSASSSSSSSSSWQTLWR